MHRTSLIKSKATRVRAKALNRMQGSKCAILHVFHHEFIIKQAWAAIIGSILEVGT